MSATCKCGDCVLYDCGERCVCGCRINKGNARAGRQDITLDTGLGRTFVMQDVDDIRGTATRMEAVDVTDMTRKMALHFLHHLDYRRPRP